MTDDLVLSVALIPAQGRMLNEFQAAENLPSRPEALERLLEIGSIDQPRPRPTAYGE